MLCGFRRYWFAPARVRSFLSFKNYRGSVLSGGEFSTESSLSGTAGKLRGQQNRRNHALGIGNAKARDVERGPVIDRRPHERQTQGDIDRMAECNQLHRNQSLVVITADHDIELAATGSHEEGVGRKWSRYVD